MSELKFVCMLLVGIAGIVVICSVPMPHFLSAAIGIFSSVLAIVGGICLWAFVLDNPDDDDDDDDGPHFYGPGGTIV